MISIIIPLYNSEKYLDQCVQSVISQSFKDFELILINDGSTDGSGTICESWTQRDSRIHTFYQKNRGVSAARNLGLSKAQGKYICFIDSDDWIDEDYLETMVSEINNDNQGLVMMGLSLEYRNGKVIRNNSNYSFFSFSNTDVDPFIDFNKKNLLYGPMCILYHSDIIKEHHLFFDESLSYGEDLMFNYQYLKYVNTIHNIPVCKYHYRVGEQNSLSTTVREDKFLLQYEQWKYLVEFYKMKRIYCIKSQDYLYKRLWGIVYDGLFLYPKLKNRRYSYLKDVLIIPEIRHLRGRKHLFHCSSWIKNAIIYRCVIVFYIYFSLKG